MSTRVLGPCGCRGELNVAIRIRVWIVLSETGGFGDGLPLANAKLEVEKMRTAMNINERPYLLIIAFP